MSSKTLNNGSAAKSNAQQKEAQRVPPIVIKKYANRRLYNTDTSAYVTLDDLATMVRSERDFEVYDAKTGENLTHSVLTQIIVEQESKTNENLLPIGFLRQLIRFYGNSMERLVPSYLEYSLDTLTREQEKYRQQFAGAFSAAALEAMQEQTMKNLAMFEQAFSMFSPFKGFDAQSASGEPAATEQQKPANTNDEIAQLKAQLASIQTQLDKIAEKK